MTATDTVIALAPHTEPRVRVTLAAHYRDLAEAEAVDLGRPERAHELLVRAAALEWADGDASLAGADR